MRDANIFEGSAPALVLVMPSIGGATRSKADDSKYKDDSQYEEDHEGNVFVGLKYVMVFYGILALGMATAWKLYQLFG